MKLSLILIILLYPFAVFAQTPRVGEVTTLPIPRFVSLRGDTVYARSGPGTRYPVKWVYNRKNLPVEITREFDTWRKIRDVDGEEGWIHQSLLSGKRFAILTSETATPLYRDSNDQSRVMALIEPRALMAVDACQSTWCSLSKSGYSGWIPVDVLWGVYESEQIK
jgi:SH3-like domain-containing protein